MHNPGDDIELDNLTRNAAEQYTIPAKPNWPKMKATLDKELPVEKKRIRLIFWLLFPALLAAGAGYWLLTADKGNENISPVNDTNAAYNPPPTEQKIKASQSHASHSMPEQKIQKEQYTAPILTDQPIKSGTNTAVHKKNTSNNAPAITTDKNIPSTKDIQADNTRHVLPDKQNTITAIENDKNKTSTTAKNIINTTATQAEQSTAAINHDSTKPQTDLPNPESLPPYKAALSYPAFGEGLSLSAIAGIDKSTVKFSYGDEPGYNVGVIAGYHFTKKFSIHSGTMYTQKNYTMAGKDFTAPKGAWIGNFKIDTVEGYCRMWEVPLLARYVVKQLAKTNYFISTGFSSYLITSEYYKYYYQYQGRPTSRDAAYKTGGNYIFSLLHFSAGFEKRLSKNLSLQIEPYAKIPLSGMGRGTISLSSFGLNLGLQFRQLSVK